MHLSDFDYELPEALIAQQPLAQRDSARMLILDRSSRSWQDSTFSALPEQVRADDVVVANNTRVFPARLLGRRDPSGGRVEVLLVREVEGGEGYANWEALVRPAHRLKPGARLSFGDPELHAEILGTSAAGLRILKFAGGHRLEQLLDACGQTPLPPYIHRPAGSSDDDRERYQTVFARRRGAIAAPTAGLHFIPATIAALESRGARVVEITLHVGYGTFEPVRVAAVEQHRVAAEYYEVSPETAAIINERRARGGRVIAIGTTTTRALESAADKEGEIVPGRGETQLTITPGYRFRAADALLTNFHLPQSSLLLLVAAFAGHEFVMAAYRHAVAARFRFYSYGDCMFVI